MTPAPAGRPSVPRGVLEAMQSRSLTVRVRYCGGCNPDIDRASIVNRLKQISEETGMHLTFRKDRPADRLLLVNGCPRACLEEEYQGNADLTRCVSVEGSNLITGLCL